ncbi:MAG: hypothetical protein KGH84_12180, partial [Paracoccaceae bacterium]|nr:hypothetical protein [Paracoccaceae bacterium]
ITSPWNVTFWLAAVGRPEMANLGVSALMLIVAAVLLGALTWGLIWSSTVMLVHARVSSAVGKWGSVVMNGGTGLLMLYFIVGSVRRLFGA